MRAAAARLAATAARRASAAAATSTSSASSSAGPFAASCSASMPLPLRTPTRSLAGWAGPVPPPGRCGVGGGNASGRPVPQPPAPVPLRPLLLLPGARRALHPPPAAAFANLPGGVPDKKGGAGGGRVQEGEGAASAAAAASASAWNAAASSFDASATTPASAAPDGPDSHFESPAERAALARELHTVSVAITANAAIFLAKIVAFAATGSSAMLAEGIHSAVDTCNQALLRVGVVRSRRAPTAAHPYGFMKDKFVFSLISACGIFCLGAGANVMHGVQALLDIEGAAPPTHLGWALGVLGVSAVVEGYSLAVAVRSVSAGAAAAGLPFREYVARGVDPTSVAVMLEDGAAVAGLGVAGVATLLTAATGSVVPDAAGSLAVGLLMGATAVFLIGQNRSLLIGRAMHPVDMQRVLNHLARDPVVRAVFDAKSEEIGPGIFRFKAEIEFDGARVVARHLARLGGPAAVAAPIRAAAGSGSGGGWAGSGGADAAPGSPPPPPLTDAALDAALAAYGQDMVGALGVEVDRIEASIRAFMPAIRHIDLEADRGRGLAPLGPPPTQASPAAGERSDPPPVDINSLSDPAYVFNVSRAAAQAAAQAGRQGPPPPPPPPPPAKGV